jgi:hypothetical protein
VDFGICRRATPQLCYVPNHWPQGIRNQDEPPLPDKPLPGSHCAARRSQPGDAEKALAHYQRHLQISEKLLRDNPDSAQAARDVMISLERMANITGKREDAEAAQRALEFQKRALEIAIRLRDGNPQSVFHGRTVAVSFILTFRCAQAAGKQELAKNCLASCHSVLHQLITSGCQLDRPMMQLYQQLSALAGGA